MTGILGTGANPKVYAPCHAVFFHLATWHFAWPICWDSCTMSSINELMNRPTWDAMISYWFSLDHQKNPVQKLTLLMAPQKTKKKAFVDKNFIKLQCPPSVKAKFWWRITSPRIESTVVGIFLSITWGKIGLVDPAKKLPKLTKSPWASLGFHTNPSFSSSSCRARRGAQ